MPRLKLSGIAALIALLAGAGVPAATIAATAASAAATTYTITDLGSLGGGVTISTAINAAGQVTGDSTLHKVGEYHTFLWTNGKMTDLGGLAEFMGVSLSAGAAINDSGQVVGTATDNRDDNVAALWTGRKITPLPGLDGTAVGINDAGQIVGGAGGVFVITGGTQTFLSPPFNPEVCSAVAINNNGQILGACAQPGAFGPIGSAVVWTNGTPRVLPTLGGPLTIAGPKGAFPTAINSNGQVVGTAETSTGAIDGFVVTNGTITDLGPTFAPAAINDNGVIVGGQFIDSNGTLQNLNNLVPAGSGYQIQSATGINDNGQIIANAIDTATGQQHALLLTPS
jgi:probable HAF family extracellular repeat protein